MLPVDVIGPLHDLIQYLTVKSLSTRRVEHCISVAGGEILRDSNCIQALKPDAHQALWAYRVSFVLHATLGLICPFLRTEQNCRLEKPKV